MKPKVAEALEESIKKWDRNSRVRNPENFLIDRINCPLCYIFNRGNGGCDGCPVKDRTGEDYCRGTPYRPAFEVWGSWSMSGKKSSAKTARKHAKEEVKFLKSLRVPT